MNVNSVGYYKEMPHATKATESIYDHINKEKQENVDNICRYLESGVEFIVSPGKVEDVIKPENGTAGSPSTFTDGIWCWPGDLSYYVRKYRLKLPDEFISTMQSRDWKCNLKFEDLDYDEIIIDGVDYSDAG